MQKREKKKRLRNQRRLPGETDGAFCAHLRKLKAKYIEVRKEFADRNPVTWYRALHPPEHKRCGPHRRLGNAGGFDFSVAIQLIRNRALMHCRHA
jgi:hypothetical protein